MPEDKRQFETGTAINYKSQGIAVLHLRYCGIFNKNLLQIHCSAECACKIILRSVNIWLSYRQESWLPHALSVSGHCCWKMKNSPDVLSIARNSCC